MLFNPERVGGLPVSEGRTRSYRITVLITIYALPLIAIAGLLLRR